MFGIWRVDPNSLPPPVGGKRRIRDGPVIDLRVLQHAIESRSIDEDQLWVATQSCARDLQNLQLQSSAVLQMLGQLLDSDYNRSEWCTVMGDREVLCDVYRFRYDFGRAARNSNGLETYLKFSIDEDGTLTIVLVSCHLSR